jgi:hypothetical protein
VPKAPPHAVSTRSSPRCQSHTHSRMRDESSDGPQTAVSSIYPQLPEESCPYRVNGCVSGQSNDICCSGMENVSEHWAVHPALPPTVQVMNLPVSQDPTRPLARYNPTYGRELAVSSIHPRIHEDSCHRHLEDVECCPNDELGFFCRERRQ